MHTEAYEWAAVHATDEPVDVLDIGGRNINGSTRDLFPAANYTSIDLYPGNGVDVVADVVTWPSTDQFDVVVCCEVLEHNKGWRDILAAAYDHCRPGGRLIVTCAGPGRWAHSAIHGGPLKPGEFYENVSPDDMEAVLALQGWKDITVDVLGKDVRAVATK